MGSIVAAAVGLLLAGASAIFPWYVFFNESKFGIDVAAGDQLQIAVGNATFASDSHRITSHLQRWRGIHMTDFHEESPFEFSLLSSTFGGYSAVNSLLLIRVGGVSVTETR